MREDMAKVLVERTRGGRRIRFNLRRCAFERKSRSKHDQDALAERMPIRFSRTKYLSENLEPLKRFLRSRRDRPWYQVYAEIRRGLAPKNAVDMHIMQHLWGYVLRTRRDVNGKLVMFGHDG